MKSPMSSMDDFVDFGSFQNHEMLSIVLGKIGYKHTFLHRILNPATKYGQNIVFLAFFSMFTFFVRIHRDVHFFGYVPRVPLRFERHER